MKESFFKNFSYERRMFCVFLLVHFCVWTLLPLVRTVLPTDALEGIYWGSLHDFGTPKHPPLAGWLTYLAYMPFKLDFFVYLISQLFVLLGFIFIYKLANKFLSLNEAILSVVIMEGCWCYSYITGYYGFNPDVILLGLLPVITYSFYKCMKFNNPIDWIILGVIVGVSFLNKYQTAMLIIPMACWALCFRKNTFKNPYFYIAILIAFIIFLPHLLWLFQHNFFPFMYFEGELNSSSWLNHITAPLMFLFMQLIAVIGVLVIYGLVRLISKQPFKFLQNKPKEDVAFLLMLGFGPILIHLIMGVIDGGSMRPRWGYEFWYMLGIILFYFFPFEISKREFNLIFKFSYIVMAIIFVSLGTLLCVEKNYRSRYPVNTIYNDIQKIWHQNIDTPLLYVGGYIEWTLPVTIYGDSHPDCILDTFGYKNPWIDENKLKESGIFIFDRTKDAVIHQTKMSCPYLSDEYEIKPSPYSFELTNAFRQPREYSIYYFIVPPMK